MKYYESLNQTALVNLIKNTKRQLFLSLPSIHEEIASAITELSYHASWTDTGVDIYLLVDFDAQTFRQGYGDHESVADLIRGEFNVRTLSDNRISFIISDDVGYYLFIESRSLIPADKETINAVRIDQVGLVRLKKHFFDGVVDIDYEDELANAIIEESRRLENANELLLEQIAPVVEISVEKLAEVGDDLKKNPPLNPDYKRIVEFYSNKFQYVKMKFEGANLKHRKIEIPPNALPLADARLKKRMEAKLNLFDPANTNSVFAPLEKLNAEINKVREKYLVKVKSREESLLDMRKKVEFSETIETLQDEIKNIQEKILKDVSIEISGSKKALRADLEEFLKVNPKALFPESKTLWDNDQNFINEMASEKATEIVFRIKWPDAEKLLNDFNLVLQYSDITFEDLKNDKFIAELKEIRLIDSHDADQLADFSVGIGTIKSNKG